MSPLRHRAEKCAEGFEKQGRLRGFGLSEAGSAGAELFSEVGNPTAPHRSRIGAWRGPGAGLVRAWCGPGAGLAQAWQSWVGHRIAASIQRHTQDCPDGAVLARAQPCDGAGPAVELPGLRHIVYAQDEGQVMPPPPRAIVVHAAAWEDVGRIGIYALSGCLAGRQVAR